MRYSTPERKPQEMAAPNATAEFIPAAHVESSVASLSFHGQSLEPSTFSNLVRIPLHTEIAGATIGSTIKYRDDTDLNTSTPVILKGGLGASAELYDECTDWLADLGWLVVNCGAPRTQDAVHALAPRNLHDALRLQSQATWSVARSMIVEGYTDQVTLVGHSMGGAVVVDTATHHPETIASVLLIASIGFGHSKREATINFGKLGLFDIAPELIARALHGDTTIASQALHHTAHNPAQFVLECIGAMGSTVEERVVTLQEQGIPVDTLWFEHDLLFPKKFSQRASKLARSSEIVPNVGHGALQLNPSYAALAIHNALMRSSHWSPTTY